MSGFDSASLLDSAVNGPARVLDGLQRVVQESSGWAERPDLYLLLTDNQGVVRPQLVPTPNSLWDGIAIELVPLLLAGTGNRMSLENLHGVALRFEVLRLAKAGRAFRGQGIRVRLRGDRCSRELAAVHGYTEHRMMVAATLGGDRLYAEAARKRDGSATNGYAQHLLPAATDQPLRAAIAQTVAESLTHLLSITAT